MEEIKVKFTRDEAIKELNSFKKRLDYKDLKSLLNEDKTENDDGLSQAKETIINGIRLGLIYFDDRNKAIVQKLLYPFNFNGDKVEELSFFKRLKLKNIKNIKDGNESDIICHNIATMTNEKQEKIEELDIQDLEFSAAIFVFLQGK